ncbi:MAG: 1-deoxy-D-xylulose-5-phosphate reductoisomerase [Culicoidibacterales bacterium]
MKEIVLLGATGSIGTQTLQVIRTNPKEYQLTTISVHTNIVQAWQIVNEFSLKSICVYDEVAALAFQQKASAVGYKIEVLTGLEGLITLVKTQGNFIMNALVGSVGVLPTIEALKLNKDVALANKETLVTAGRLVMEYARKSSGKLIPVDSEHSAIFQCLEPNYEKELKQIIITASGGSLRDVTKDELAGVTIEQVLAHPNWSMGNKITVDSATMMNKGFEVIEAKWLFDIPFEQIHVALHRQSTVHSLVEYVDGSILAHLGKTDMRIPIQYALTYPKREVLSPLTSFDWSKPFSLDFEPISLEQFPILKLAFDAGKAGKTYAAALNAANEVAVNAFLLGKIHFTEITPLLTRIVESHQPKNELLIEDILLVDQQTRKQAKAYINKLTK